jgi:hypothetical protein
MKPHHTTNTMKALGAVAVLSGVVFGIPAVDAGKAKVTSEKAGAANGEWVVCKRASESRDEGENRLVMLATTAKFTGTLKGTYEGTERDVLHKDGSASFNGSGVFSGQINGRSGTAVIIYSGRIDANGAAMAQWVIDKGTDELTRIDGQGAFEAKQMPVAMSTDLECAGATSHSVWTGKYAGTLNFSR